MLIEEQKTRKQIFVDEYRKLETIIRNKYGIKDYSISPIMYIQAQPEFRDISAELDYCRALRNFFSHTPDYKDGVQPTAGLIDLLDQTIQRVKNPPLVMNHLIPVSKVLCAGIDDLVLPKMRQMNEQVYTHIPILDNGIVVGVFSENTIFSYLTDEGIIGVEENTRFIDIQNYLPINAHKAECFRFVGRRTPIGEVRELYSEAMKAGDRIGLIFVTETGKLTEKLLGIISAWDIAGI